MSDIEKLVDEGILNKYISKDKINELLKIIADKEKEEKKEKDKYIFCCGKKISKKNILKHRKTEKHILKNNSPK